ncbi:MAG: carboxypeptidase regulatory-like domain-containing protein [Chloroflexi bacterium]|nr:carboxypeptidase regulatory-like domain-containing protein [Chloroflexota bacterium]
MFSRRQFLRIFTVSTLAGISSRFVQAQPTVSLSGQVLTSEGNPIASARVTGLASHNSFFQEARTDASGNYLLLVPASLTYMLGVSAPGREYQEIPLTVTDADIETDFSLGLDQHPGIWQVVGSTEPETFGGTNSGSVLPDGRIFYCHDATDPILFNPITGETSPAARSSSEQGCHMPTLLPDGHLLIIAGGTIDDAGNFSGDEEAIATVKAYDPTGNVWENWPDLNEPRWYPGFARLPDGKFLLFGGGQQPDLLRTDSCEILDPETRESRMTGSMLRAGGFGPAILLLTGEVLLTWEPPQLYNPTTGQWRATGDFVQPNRAEVRT